MAASARFCLKTGLPLRLGSVAAGTRPSGRRYGTRCFPIADRPLGNWHDGADICACTSYDSWYGAACSRAGAFAQPMLAIEAELNGLFASAGLHSLETNN